MQKIIINVAQTAALFAVIGSAITLKLALFGFFN